MGPLPAPVQHKSDQNPDFCHEHALTPTHTHTFRTQCKVLRELPKTYQQSFWQKIRLFKQNPDQIRTNFLKKVRIRTKVRKIGPNWRDCSCLKLAADVSNKARENQTRFGMVSERLSTHPSGKKTSAAHFKRAPTRRLVVQLNWLKLLFNEY